MGCLFFTIIIILTTLYALHEVHSHPSAQSIQPKQFSKSAKAIQFPGPSQANKLIKFPSKIKTDVAKNCDASSKFRTINGNCNNLEQPNWGESGQPFPREIAIGKYNPKLDITITCPGMYYIFLIDFEI